MNSICTTTVSLVLLSALAAPALPAAGTAAAAPAAVASSTLAGKSVFLDPGHQAGGSPEQLSRPVANGRGGTKECQTSGMTAVGGVPEHTITWQVAQLVKTSLEGLGAAVALSRPDNTGWGGCVTDRAQAANASGAQVAVSIHADGAPQRGRGFHLIVPQLPLPNPVANQAQAGAGMAATRAVRAAYLKSGFTPAAYIGGDGIQTRSDLAGPALTTVPNVFLEMGNGADPQDARLLTTPEGQVRHAVAITAGVVGYLLGADPSRVESAMKPGVPAARTPDQPTMADPQPAVRPSLPSGAGERTDATQPGENTGGVSELGQFALTLLGPLLQTAGIDPPGGASKVVGTMSELASRLLSVAVQNMRRNPVGHR